MITKLGFISNSSSSSFVLIADAKTITKCFQKMSKFGKDVVDEVYLRKSKSEIKLNGKEYFLYFGENNSEDFAYNAIEAEGKRLGVELDHCEWYDKAVKEGEKFVSLLKKEGGIFEERD